MSDKTRKLSDIMKEMSERLLRDPAAAPSSEAAHVALFFANVAWNECVGIDHARECYRNVWESIEANNPALWNELKSNDIDGMVDELVVYKKGPLPGRPTTDSRLRRHAKWQHPRGMARSRRSRGRCQVGNATLRIGAGRAA